MRCQAWQELVAAQHLERKRVLEGLSMEGLTQAQAARILGVTRTALNNAIRRYGVEWRIKKQGVRQ